MTADDYIRLLSLTPHPEGGYYRQTYRAPDMLVGAALPARYDGPRAAATAIYFLLRDDDVSHLHRLQSDEVWHFYTGAALVVHVLMPDGTCHSQILGEDIGAGMVRQFVVPRGAWFGAELCERRGFALVGNTVAPGFEFDDFELADRDWLLDQFPEQRALICRLTRPGAGDPPRDARGQ